MDRLKNGTMDYAFIKRCEFVEEIDVVCCKDDKLVKFHIEMVSFFALADNKCNVLRLIISNIRN